MLLSKDRALITPKSLKEWFENFQVNINSIDPTIFTSSDRIFNVDETGFIFNMKSRKVVACKGSKNVYSITSNKKSSHGLGMLQCVRTVHATLANISISTGCQNTTYLKIFQKHYYSSLIKGGSQPLYFILGLGIFSFLQQSTYLNPFYCLWTDTQATLLF